MKMHRTALIFAFALWSMTVSLPLWGQSPDAKPSYIPPQGVVPNQETAVRIAEAVLAPIYGEETVKYEEPFVVKLKNGVWTIHGRIRPQPGGNLYVEISKKTGCILRIYGTE
jgi:NTF2 fold immunity protein